MSFRIAIYIFLLRAAFGAGTVVLFDPSDPMTGPFPSDSLTVADPAQKTGLRLNLTPPDCPSAMTECQEIGLLRQFDGFNLRARLQVRFSGPVDTTTLRDGIFFVALENLVSGEPGVQKMGDVTRVDQVVYDPATNTAYAKPDGVLDQHRRYGLVVTDGVRDASGSPILASWEFSFCVEGFTDECAPIAQTISSLRSAAGPRQIAAATVFTTMSATAWLQAARTALPNFPALPTLLQPQSTFRIADLQGITLHEQTGSAPAAFTDLSLPLPAFLLQGLDRVVIGSFESPRFLGSDQTIRPGPTVPPLPLPAATDRIYFNALLPSTPKPANGYPVVIFGHGFGDSRFGGPTAVAPTLARSGFATIAINAVGHGFGPQSTVTFIDNAGKGTTIPAGGRGVDVNGDGLIDPEEGCALVAPVALGLRDCFRQTVVDLMQLVRVLRGGLDLDGDGTPDLDPQRIYYAGQSLGAMYGTMLTAVEPAVRAAALNVGGGTVIDIARWSPSYRGLATDALRLRLPPALNQGSTYNEDYVLPGQPVKVVTLPGALEIQNIFERLEWLGMQGDPIAFAPHLKTAPLPGDSSRPVLMQFARGDRTVPNPANTLLIWAAGLQGSAWEYRHDRARAQAPDLPANPHPFLVLFVGLDGGAIQLPGLDGLAISLDAQQQIAGFLAADGASVPDPNGLSKLLFGGPVFEIPAALPQDLGF